MSAPGTTVGLPPGVILRLPQARDAKAIRPLIEEAIGGLRHHTEQKLRGVTRSVVHAVDDWTTATLHQRSTGAERQLRLMITTRVAACERTGRLLGLTYTAPPLEWMKAANAIRTYSTANVMERAHALSQRLAEVNVLAVQRAHRGRGIARALMADVAARYAAAGYGALMVITNRTHQESLRGLYASCGYHLGNPDERWWVELGAQSRAIYHHINPGQSMHVLPLDDQVWINPGPTPPPSHTGPRLPPSLMGLLNGERPGGRCRECVSSDGTFSDCPVCGGGRICPACGRVVHRDGRACRC